MAKKKETPRQMPVRPADLNDERWINTPFSYTKFGGDLTLLQQDIMLRVSEHMQDHIKKYFDEDRHLLKQSPNGLFSENDLLMGIPDIHISLKELGLQASNYGEVKAALDDIFNLKIKALSEDGKTMTWFHVFGKMNMPMTAAGYNKGGADGEVREFDRSAGYINVSVNPYVAKYVFDMSKGYINHLVMIAKYSTRKSTPRIYLYLKYQIGFRSKVKVDVMELKEYLGLVKRDEETNEVVSVQYAKFSQFMKQVLDVAQADLDRMSLRNETDITFCYKPVYRGNVRRGDPEYIEFTVKRTDLGQARIDVKSGKRKVAEPAPVMNDVNAHVQEAKPLAIDFGDGMLQWTQLLDTYHGEASEALRSARFIGLRGGAFFIACPKNHQILIQQEGGELYDMAREILGLKSKFQPPIVFDVER